MGSSNSTQIQENQQNDNSSINYPNNFSMSVKIKKLKENVVLPIYKTSGSSGMDIKAFIDEDITIKPNERKAAKKLPNK